MSAWYLAIFGLIGLWELARHRRGRVVVDAEDLARREANARRRKVYAEAGYDWYPHKFPNGHIGTPPV